LAPAVPPAADAIAKPMMPWGGSSETRKRGTSAQQQAHLDGLIARYTARTAKSKAEAQQYRRVLADSRATVGFRLSTKELLYPISGARSQGSRLWDIDGNEYLDYTMGFGVHLLGHRPDVVQPVIAAALDQAVEIGMRSDVAGEVATLLTECTGLDRFAFTNSGTEAVMAAVRLARAKTGRDKLVIFSHAYHGHADITLARSANEAGRVSGVPLVGGVPPRQTDDVLVLEYGDDSALDIIRRHGHEIAAVMVEPVQSRNLRLQPRAFLQALRTLTRETGSALIFDEMITGFRAHLGGAQAHFGVQADLATYGKIIGGGLPIGAVGGTTEWMDGIDGGFWQYGDLSYPQAERTAFGGTFCQHPLSMAAARAVLRHLKAEGPALQETLNARTSTLVSTLNTFFREEEVPITATNFSSLFRFEFSSNLDLLFYHMLEKGIYIWEWRSCFLSTAHTDDDVDRFTTAMQETVDEMRRGGFVPPPTRTITRSAPVTPASSALSTKALSFTAAVSMPTQAAASSSSRIAAIARPSRSCSSRAQSQQTSASNTRVKPA
jgi:glutamate-1-semialdehyde aminotransferase